MKISTRLAMAFSTISSFIFIVSGTIIYFFSAYYEQHDFQVHLKERVEIIEKVFLEKDSFETLELKKIKDQFLRALPQETKELVPIQENTSPHFKYDYPQNIKIELFKHKISHFKYAGRQGLSKKFLIKGKYYLIIVSAVDTLGTQQLSHLRTIIAILIFIGIPFMFIGSFVMTKRALLPISQKIDKANTISVSNLDQRLSIHNPNDELGKMAIAFNNLLERLEASFESQKSFIRNASHEIRNPLTAIIGEAEIALSRSRSNEAYMVSLDTILNEAEILSSTVTNLLQLSKVTANEEQIRGEHIQFDLFLEEIKKSFDFMTPDNQITLVVQSSPKEGYSIFGNKALLKTALLNLFDNACKFSFNRQVDVGLSQSCQWLVVTINDQGIGILETDIEKIKTPFYRGHNALKIKGSGIGLALSSKIIKIHEGELDIQSKADIGTQIQVKLPLISS